MKADLVRSSGSTHALRAATRLLLCLAPALLPLSTVGAAHFDDHTAAAAHGHDDDCAPANPATDAPLCHHAGACYAFVSPAAPAVAPLQAATRPEVTTLREPASAAVHRLFRPPISGRA